MIDEPDTGKPRPSLADRLAMWLGGARAPRPASYWPALGVLAAIPGLTALLAVALAWGEGQRTAALRHDHAGRIAAIAAAQRNTGRRAQAAPFFAVPTVTAELAAIVETLPSDATLRSIARDADGAVRIEVDCPDPDALLRAFRQGGARVGWRSSAQTAIEGSGIRVTLERTAR